MSDPEPVFDIAHLAHVELLTPTLDESAAFFTGLMGLCETAREDGVVYLRGYEESYHHSLKLTQSNDAGLGHLGWRATSPAALERRVAKIEAMGAGVGWVEDVIGYGPTYEFLDTDGHRNRIFWEVERAVVPDDLKSPLLNRPQKRPLTGVPVRRLDHVNLMCSDVAAVTDFFQEATGARLREKVVADAGPTLGAWLSHNNLNHDVALTMDGTGSKGRLHHVAFYYGFPQHLDDMANVMRERGVRVEAGPGRHGITQGSYLYCFEPGGNRIEMFGDEGYLIFDPDWEPVIWREKDLQVGLVWYGGELPSDGFVVGTPHVPLPANAPTEGKGPKPPTRSFD